MCRSRGLQHLPDSLPCWSQHPLEAGRYLEQDEDDAWLAWNIMLQDQGTPGVRDGHYVYQDWGQQAGKSVGIERISRQGVCTSFPISCPTLSDAWHPQRGFCTRRLVVRKILFPSSPAHLPSDRGLKKKGRRAIGPISEGLFLLFVPLRGNERAELAQRPDLRISFAL